MKVSTNLYMVVFPQINETDPSENILSCIEKQALVQVIIREFAKHLVPDNYILVACVSLYL